MSDSVRSSFPVSVSSSANSSIPEGEGADYWQYHLECWVQSGLSQSGYCRRHGLNYKKYHNWKTRLKSYPSGKSVKLVEVKRDFTLDAASPGPPDSIVSGGLQVSDTEFSSRGGPGGFGLPGVRSGIRFWLGEFCIEVDVPFSSPCLSQLLVTPRDFQRCGCDDLATGVNGLPADLPRIEIVYDLSEGEKQCGCGCELSRIGEESSEKLEMLAPQFWVLRHVRYKYACKHCEGVESNESAVKLAPVPVQILPKTIATPSLLAHVFISKFADALPFYRQEKQFLRYGLPLPRATMCNWAFSVYDKLMCYLNCLFRSCFPVP